MSRKIEDAKLATSKALPAANANTNSDAIKVGKQAAMEAMEVVFGHGAVPALVEAKTLTIKLQHSDNGTSGWADVPGLAALVSTGAVGNGAPAKNHKVRLPGNTKEFIRANAAVENGGGANTAVDFVLKAKF
jgi:hypothetical protein